MPKKEGQNKKLRLTEQLMESIDLPKESAMNIPIITLLGNREIAVENFNSIVEYGANTIRLYTTSGMLTIEGEALEAKSMSAEGIKIKGNLTAILFGK